jgi:ferredoxin-NADP reductase
LNTTLPWRVATVASVRSETTRARTFALDVPDWPGHIAGQHVDIRLTADDGYQAQRSYSIASAPESAALELTVDLVDDGEVSPYFVEEVRSGDQFELRGPIGGYFTWRSADGGPLLLVAGGSGIVPLMAMLRHRALARSDAEVRLLVSARTWDDVLYRDELVEQGMLDGVTVVFTLTREAPPDWTGFTRRIDAAMLSEIGPGEARHPRIHVCGPTGFVEEAADLLVALGHRPLSIKAERFGG